VAQGGNYGAICALIDDGLSFAPTSPAPNNLLIKKTAAKTSETQSFYGKTTRECALLS